MTQVKGIVEGVVFSNAQSGFAVIEVDTSGELLTAVGQLSYVLPGEEITLFGFL